MSWECAGGCTCKDEDGSNPLVVILGFFCWGIALSVLIVCTTRIWEG